MANQQQLEDRASRVYMGLRDRAEWLAAMQGEVIPHARAAEAYTDLAQWADRFSRACRAVADYAAERAR